MDILKELKLINSEYIIDSLIDEAMEQKKIWDKKAHMLKVFNLTREIELLAETKAFEKDDIATINIANYGSGSSNHIGIILFSSNFEMLKNPTKEEYKRLLGLFAQLSDFDIKNTNGPFSAYIDLKKDIKPQMYKVLLSKELLEVLQDNELQIQTPNNSKSKRHKV